MRTLIVSCAVITVFTIGACSVAKKSAQKPLAVAPAPVPVPVVTATPRIPPSVHSTDGIYPPDTAELTALQQTHKDVTMQTLKQGYKLYTGVCTNCHQAQSIYQRPVSKWPEILTAMAKEAKISDAQKDAIYKYVLSIKATQSE